MPNIKKTYSEEEVKEELMNFLKEAYNKQEKSINKRIDSLNEKILDNINEESIIKKIDNFNRIVKNLEEKKKDYEIVLKLQKDEELFLNETLQGTSIEIKNVDTWINEGHKYHKPINFSKCLYCRNDISEEIKEDYTTMLKNSYISSLSEYTQELKLRLFCNKCERIDTQFIFMDDIKLGSKLIHELLENIETDNNICYVEKKKLYRVAIYMRKFLETFINNIITISNPKLEADSEECIKFLKDNINSDITKDLLKMSTNIIKETKKGLYIVNEYMQKLIESMHDIIFNYRLFKEDANLNNMIEKLYEDKKIFYIKDDLEHKIIADLFKVDCSLEYEQILIDTMIRGLITQIKVDYSQNEIECTKKKAEQNFLSYLRHVNDNVGRPVLAVNSDSIIDNMN